MASKQITQRPIKASTRQPTITVRIDHKLRRRLARIAEAERRSLANVIEIAVVKFLEERKSS